MKALVNVGSVLEPHIQEEVFINELQKRKGFSSA
ncbi:MAG: hypothetical protein K0Q94_5418 [Paenibacillus sp.]|jgi:hypothetical protein|nr:hypothetical protein [Paenibacillus sp.]